MRVTAEIEGGMLVIRVPLAEFPLRSNLRLSRRESEVLDLLCAANENKEIANALCISTRTVKEHVSALLKKFHVRSRGEMMIARLTNAAATPIVSASTGGKNHHAHHAAQL